MLCITQAFKFLFALVWLALSATIIRWINLTCLKISALWPQGMHEEAKTVITPKHTLLRHVVYCCGRFAGNIKYIPDKYDYMNLEWANLYTVLLIDAIVRKRNIWISFILNLSQICNCRVKAQVQIEKYVIYLSHQSHIQAFKRSFKRMPTGSFIWSTVVLFQLKTRI